MNTFKSNFLRSLLVRTLAVLFMSFALVSCAGSSGTSYVTPEFEGASLKDSESQLRNSTGSQGELVAADILYGGQVDASGSWVVCTQSVAPGERSNNTAVMKLGVVPAGETCPETGVKQDIVTYEELAEKENQRIEKEMKKFDPKKVSHDNYAERDLKALQKKIGVSPTGKWDNDTLKEVYRLNLVHNLDPGTSDWSTELDSIVFTS